MKQYKHLIFSAFLCLTLAACGSSSVGSGSSDLSSVQTSTEPTVLTQYQQILLGEASFRFFNGEDSPQSMEIDRIPALFGPEESTSVGYFSVLDLDGDGEEETVLHLICTSGDMGGYLILHQNGEEIYGFPSGWRTFWSLKADGTFLYSQEGGTEDGIASIQFTETGIALNKQLYGTGDWFIFDRFFLDGQEISKLEYDQALLQQDQKPNAPWYPFTQENVNAVLLPPKSE